MVLANAVSSVLSTFFHMRNLCLPLGVLGAHEMYHEGEQRVAAAASISQSSPSTSTHWISRFESHYLGMAVWMGLVWLCFIVIPAILYALHERIHEKRVVLEQWNAKILSGVANGDVIVEFTENETSSLDGMHGDEEEDSCSEGYETAIGTGKRD